MTDLASLLSFISLQIAAMTILLLATDKPQVRRMTAKARIDKRSR